MARHARNAANKDSPGYLYALHNESFREGIFKIGRTGRTIGAHLRSQQLYTTAVPTPFEVVMASLVPTHMYAERAAHALLEAYRVNPRREFFDLRTRDIGERMLQKIFKKIRALCRWRLLVNGVTTESVRHKLQASLRGEKRI